MSYPPEDPRWPAGADDNQERPETSWLSNALPEGVGEPPAPVQGNAPTAPTQPQAWHGGPTPYQPTGPAPAQMGYPSGYPQQPPDGAPGAAPTKGSKGRVVAAVLAVVLVVGAGIAVWQLWPQGGGGDAAPTATSTSQPTCWDPGITGQCPQFVGRDAALYVFSPKDEAHCAQSSLDDQDAPGAVDAYECRLDDLGTSAYIIQWASPDDATNAWMRLPTDPDLPWYGFEDRWTVDGEEMGDLLVGPDVGSGNEFHAQCYDDLPFCMWTLGTTGKGGTGEKGDWTLVRDKFDPLDAQEVEALNAFLADHPSLATPTPTPRATGTAAPDDYEITDLNSVERSVEGQLAKGSCFDTLPDLAGALHTPTVVETIPCADPHLSQVVGFVDISDIGSRDDDASQVRYVERCQSLMSADGVPGGLLEHGTVYYPSPEEVAAGVRVAMCLVHTNMPWTGSALDGTAAGY